MRVEERLSRYKTRVDEEVARILGRKDSGLFEAMRYAVLSGGKRYRPLLLLSSGEYFNAGLDVLLPFSCAIELIHNYSLVHDDLPSMDNDDLRRGKPTCHKVFGEDIALLAGDSLLTLAFEVLAEASVPPGLYSQKEEAIRVISQGAGATGMIEGQLLDITLSPDKATEDFLHKLVLKKTGALIMASVRTGGILGRASALELEALADYGKNVGFAFQIRDDLQDAEEGCRTRVSARPDYVSLIGLAGAKKKLREFVQEALAALEKASISSEELKYLALMLLDIKD